MLREVRKGATSVQTAARFLRAFALLAGAFAVSACVQPSYFRHPISPPGEAGYDERLIGSWLSRTDQDAILQLVIMPLEAEGESDTLAIIATISNAVTGADGHAFLARYPRIAHASIVDGETYYNVRATGMGSAFAKLDDSGRHAPTSDEVDWLVTPPHADREYWIVKAEITDDGSLWLHFVEIYYMLNEAEEHFRNLERHFGSHLQGASFWSESCGEHCVYARADLRQGTLARIIREFPVELVFGLSAGPFVPLDAALPEFTYPK